MKGNEPRIQNHIIAFRMRQALQSQYDNTPQPLLLKVNLQVGSDVRRSPTIVVRELHKSVKDPDPYALIRHTVLGSLGLLMVISVAIGRITMAAGAPCMNLGADGRVKEFNRFRKDMRL